MCDHTEPIGTGVYDSSTSISWKAHREAENVCDQLMIPQLIEFIDNEKSKEKRGNAYFLLGHIAKNTNNSTALNYLIARVESETDKYIISSLLDRISNVKKPLGTNLQPLILATKNKKWLIRHSAIRSLDNSEDSIAESALIEIIDNSDDPFDLTYANSVINTIGTLRSIPYLEKHLKSRKRDVKDTAKYAIEEISKREAIER